MTALSPTAASPTEASSTAPELTPANVHRSAAGERAPAEDRWALITPGREVPVGATVWLTGLSGAGKSTIADGLAEVLGSSRPVEVLDGDECRERLSPGLGFTKADRDAHVIRVGYLARLLARNGVLVLVPVIAPYRQARAAVRADHATDGTAFVQIHVATPLTECARRDVKGLYAKAVEGAVRHLTGVDDPYETPVNADLVMDTTGMTTAQSVAQVIDLLEGRGLL